VLAPGWDTVRLSLHILAATIWVGGQLVLAGLVPALRPFGAQVPRAAARRYNQIAWPAFAVLVLTGLWNLAAVDGQQTTSYRAVVIAKLAVVLVSGVTAYLHIRARTSKALAWYGGLSGATALTAVVLGVLLAG
jgi:putative copper export protein